MTQNNFKIYANHEFSVAYPPGWNVEQLDSGVAFSTEGASQYARIQILQNLNGAKTLDDYLGDNEKVKQEAAKRGSKIW